VDRDTDSTAVVLVVATDVDRDPVVNVGAQTVTLRRIELTDTMNETSNAFLEEIVKVTGRVLEGELRNNLVYKTEIVSNNSIKTTTILTTANLQRVEFAGQFDLLDMREALGFAHKKEIIKYRGHCALVHLYSIPGLDCPGNEKRIGFPILNIP
jgi:hypothetical protein